MAVLIENKSLPPAKGEVRNKPRDNKNASPRLVNVLVHWKQGKTLCLQVDPMTTCVSELATMVWQQQQQQQAQTSSLPRDFCMTCRGKVLDAHDDGLTLTEMVGPIATDGCLHVQAFQRQRGGCFMVSFSILCTIIAAIVGSTCTCGLSLLIVPLLLPLLFILPLFCL